MVKAQLKKRLSQKGLDDCIFFLDPVAPSDVSEYISSATIAVIQIIPAALSYEFAMPNKLFEATLARLPILGSRLTEMAQFIDDHRLGKSFAPGDTKEFTDRLWEILENRTSFVGAERDAAINGFCWERQEEKLWKIYSSFGFLS